MIVPKMFKIISLLLLSIIFTGQFHIEPIECSLAMKRLYEDLFTDYNRLILPVANNKTKVTVTLGLKLGQILDLNLKQQILSTNVWVEQTWHDYKLEWQPENYEGIDMIHVPAENIWIPDIVLFNNADGNYELTLVAKATVHSNGTVVWKPPTMFRSTCEIDVEYFPFDIQTCFLRFGSWTYAGDELELRHVGNKTKVDIGVDLSQFYKNVEWDIIDVPAFYNEFYYECCTEAFPDITFKIVIRRKMLFYLVNLIIPVGLMTFMTVSVFYLPSDSQEKVTLSISILTSLIVFFLLMLEIIPASSLAVPLFGKYLLFTLVLVSLSACLSVYVLNIHHRSPAVHTMSPRVRHIFLKVLPRLLRLDRPDPHEKSSLNRFRKKKIAQQLLQESNEINYDLAQPLTQSLNLIETLNKSYNFNPKEDDRQRPKSRKEEKEEEDDGGRYFRKYVDDYIEKLKQEEAESATSTAPYRQAHVGLARSNSNQQQTQQSTGCCDNGGKCCSRANQPLRGTNAMSNQYRQQQQARNLYGGNRMMQPEGGNWNQSAADMMYPLIQSGVTKFNGNSAALHQSSQEPCDSCGSNLRQNSTHQRHQSTTAMCKSSSFGCTGHRTSHLGAMLNDDTLDMTFDYDQEDPGCGSAGGVAYPSKNPARPTIPSSTPAVDELTLPSPPPPPHLSCESLVAVANASQHMDTTSGGADNLGGGGGQGGNGISLEHYSRSASECGSKLVDKLLSSINLINNASDEIDTTTTSNEPVNHFGEPTNDTDLELDSQNPHQYGAYSNNSRSNTNNNHDQPPTVLPQPQSLHHHYAQPPSSNGNLNRHFKLQQQKQLVRGQFPMGSTMSQEFVTASTVTANTNSSSTTTGTLNKPSDLLLSLRLPYKEMPAHVRAAIRSILFIADTIKNEDDENSAIEDWESMSMVVDRLFLWIFFILCTFGSLIILALAPSLYDQRASIDDKLRIDIPPSNCSASVYAHS